MSSMNDVIDFKLDALNLNLYYNICFKTCLFFIRWAKKLFIDLQIRI